MSDLEALRAAHRRARAKNLASLLSGIADAVRCGFGGPKSAEGINNQFKELAKQENDYGNDEKRG